MTLKYLPNLFSIELCLQTNYVAEVKKSKKDVKSNFYWKWQTGKTNGMAQ